VNIVSISSRIALSLIFSASIAPLHSQITFYENGIAAGLATTFSPQGVAVADYDVDGDDDILFAGWYGVALFQNDGSAHFTNVTATSGVSRSGRYVAPIFADWDNDSDPDLFLGAQDAVGTNRLLRNDSGHFTDVTKGSGIDTLVSVGTAAAGDFNNDGRLDLAGNVEDCYRALWGQIKEKEFMVEHIRDIVMQCRPLVGIGAN